MAICLAKNGIIPPSEWYHTPYIKEKKYGYTVALGLAKNGIIPPKEWNHDPII